MALPREFNKTLHKQAGFYAAWFPVTNTLQVGNYGMIENGVFRSIGHLKDLGYMGFDVDLKIQEGNPGTIDFMSSGTKIIKTVAGVEVAELPAGDVEANLKFEFSREYSFLLKSAVLNVNQLQNIHEVAQKLGRMRKENKWSSNFRVISAVYTGLDCLVLMSKEQNTTVEFTAKASVLKDLNKGKIEVKPQISFSSDTILRQVGDTGPIGLRMFKLKKFRPGITVLSASDDELSQTEEDWGADLADDDL